MRTPAAQPAAGATPLPAAIAALPLAIRPAIAALPASRIREISRLGMGRAGVIPLWFGEGDEATPTFIRNAAAAALAAGETFYTPNRGIPALREALATYSSQLYRTAIDIDRITVTASGMNAIMIVMQCLAAAGDNVVLIGPFWPNPAEVVTILGAEARLVDLTPGDHGWQLDLDRLAAACDARTKAIFVNSPNNPTGWLMTAAEQAEVLALCRQRGIWLVADEVYARLVYTPADDGPAVAPSFLALATPEDPLIVINSFSKAWSMTGWRLGWITAPPALGAVLEKMTEYNIASPTSFAQAGGIAALQQGEPYVQALIARYAGARDLVAGRLDTCRRVRFTPPAAAFYAFFAVDGMTDSVGFCKQALERCGVGLAPGAAFGPAGEGWIRLCFAASPARLEQALDRLTPLLD